MEKVKPRINTTLTVWLLTLTLFFGFPPSTSASQHEETKPATTECFVVSRRPARRTFVYRLLNTVRAGNFIPHYFLKVVNVLIFFARQIVAITGDNFRRAYLVQYIQSRHIDFAHYAADLTALNLRG